MGLIPGARTDQRYGVGDSHLQEEGMRVKPGTVNVRGLARVICEYIKPKTGRT